MNEHALDAMIYAYQVMKEKEENKMEGIFLGKIDQTAFDPTRISLSFRTKHLDQHVEMRKELDYDCDYVLVKADDVIETNDELLMLRDECKDWEAECNDWKARYAKVNNELFQKGLAYGVLEETYKKKKAAGEVLLKDRDDLKEKVKKLEAELSEIKTTRTLREAYITGVEKGCESLREDRDMWKRRWNSVVTDIGESLKANGITFVPKEIHGDGNWDVVIDIPELNEAKKKVEDLEKKLKAAKSNETFWRDRKEEEEDYHHYWLHTFDRAVKQAADKGIHIGVRGNDEECNAGIVTVYNMKAEELEKRVVALEKTNNNLDQKIGAADNALEYWNNTYNDIVIAGKNVGVKIDIKGKKPDSNTGTVYVTNEMALELAYKLNTVRQTDDKWQAMLDALKDKGVEVIYMGEEDGKPIVDVKIPGWEMDKQWVTTFSKRVAELLADKFRLESERDELKEQCDILRKDGVLKGQQCLKLTADLNALKKECGRLISELAELKSETVAEVRYEFRPNCLTIICTKCDGTKQTISMDSSEAIDANSISCGTVPKCSSCAHYIHDPSRFAHDWCYMPIPKEGGAGYIRKLNKEESEGPACSDFKAKE